MSKLESYYKQKRGHNSATLCLLFNKAIELDDMQVLFQAQAYADGLIDAYDAILDEEASTEIEDIVAEYTVSFVNRGKDGVN